MLKKLILFFVFTSFLFAHAEVKISGNDAFSKKERKTGKAAAKRAASFYTWYLNYLNTNKTKPTQYLVMKQYTTAHMRDEAMNHTENYDVFLVKSMPDYTCTMEIIPEKIEKGRVNLNVNITGKSNYRFHIDMILQKGNWCIDLVVPEEDLNPRIHETEK